MGEAQKFTLNPDEFLNNFKYEVENKAIYTIVQQLEKEGVPGDLATTFIFFLKEDKEALENSLIKLHFKKVLRNP